MAKIHFKMYWLFCIAFGATIGSINSLPDWTKFCLGISIGCFAGLLVIIADYLSVIMEELHK